MTVAGIMSGTSADGIDVAFVHIGPQKDRLKIELIAHESSPYSKTLRTAVLAAMDARSISAAELARLNWRLGIAYAEAVRKTWDLHPCKLDLIGCHGQTIYHQGKPALYAGKKFSCTWQLGEAALIAATMRLPVVSNFRPADMAAGGQAAPLVPLLDFVWFSDTKRARVLQNIGGIANLTLVPPSSGIDKLLAFDTGPGNMVIDALTEQQFHRPFDQNGRIAARGRVLGKVVDRVLQQSFFQARPPKSAGREEFGAAFTSSFLRACKKAGGSSEDAVATATALTAQSIALAFERFVRPSLSRSAPVDYIVSGGGAKNPVLMRMLRERLGPFGCTLHDSTALGLPVEAKEAAAFALLAYYTWHRKPANVPSATGAKHLAILGQITYA